MALTVACAAGLALSGCGENAPFGRNNTASDATKLVVPDSLTPPVRIDKVAGAPAGWEIHEKVAEALRQRDIPAGTSGGAKSAYVLRGRLRETRTTDKGSQVAVAWTLYDAQGKKVGDVNQIAAVPRASMTKPNLDVVEAIADAAAESISPIVPSTRLASADNLATGEPNTTTRETAEAKNPVTAIGKMKKGESGIAKRLAEHAKGRKPAADVALPTPLAPGDDERAKTPALTAISRLDANASPLSRNFARGVNPGAGDRKTAPRDPGPPPSAETPPDRDDTAPSSADRPQRSAPAIVVQERPKEAPDPARTPARKQVADTPPVEKRGPDAVKTKQVAAKPAGRPAGDRTSPRRVVTEFYPVAAQRARLDEDRAGPSTPPKQVAAAGPLLRPHFGDVVETIGVAAADQVEKPSAGAPAPRAQTDRSRTDRAPDESRRPGNGPAFWVQVGAFRSAKEGEQRWVQARNQAPALLQRATHRIDTTRLRGYGTVHRVQVGPYGSKGDAGAMCRRLKARGVTCFVLPGRGATGPTVEANRSPETAPARRASAPARSPKITVVTNDTVRAGRKREGPGEKLSGEKLSGETAASGDKRFPTVTRPGLPGVFE